MLGEGNIWKILVSKGDQVEGKSADIEGRGTYHRSRVESGIDLTPQLDTRTAYIILMSGKRILEARE